MKTILYSSLLLLIALVLSCCDGEPSYGPPKQYKFTDDELGWIYYQNDSLYYKVNDKDTVLVQNDPHINVLDFENSYNDWGTYEDGLNFLNVHEIIPFLLAVGIEINNCGGHIYIQREIIPEEYASPISFHGEDLLKDTITINGKFYSDAYKLNTNPINSWDIKTVYFAKQYGFLKIELNDGRKIELLP